MPTRSSDAEPGTGDGRRGIGVGGASAVERHEPPLERVNLGAERIDRSLLTLQLVEQHRGQLVVRNIDPDPDRCEPASTNIWKVAWTAVTEAAGVSCRFTISDTHDCHAIA